MTLRTLSDRSAPASAAVRNVCAALLTAVDAYFDAPSCPHPPGYLVRLETSAPQITLAAWLASQPQATRLLWAGRDDGEEAAGVGAALTLRAPHLTSPAAVLDDVTAALSQADAGMRCYGGLRFNPHQPISPEWISFGAGRFVAPAIEWRQQAASGSVAVQFQLAPAPERAAQRQRLHALITGLRPPVETWEPLPLRRRATIHHPDAIGWEDRVHIALEQLTQRQVHKVVLARQSIYEFDSPLQTLALLAALQDSIPYAYHFYFQWQPGHAFLGASPERLYWRDGAHIASEALAGTRRRGRTPAEDLDLQRELLSSDKERREHRLVADFVRERLTRLCGRITCEPTPSILQLGHVQHLHQALHGWLMPGVSDSQLVAALHPTPAVGGAPQAEALHLLAELEPFDRGWYAGPVGWLSQTGAELAVAIRSGLVNDHSLRLFAGAGLVPGSVAQAEWQETDNKLAAFRRILPLPCPSTPTTV